MNILGIIPARGGSKGIPKKNIKLIAGKPLIQWSILAASKSQLLTKWIVSTEDAEIKKIAQQSEAEVLDRPARLASDTASMLTVIQHALKTHPAEVIVLLQPTSPVRQDGLIDACIRKFLATRADSLATGFLCNLHEWGTYSARRQDLSTWFHDNGCVYVTRVSVILQGKIWGEKKETIITPKDHNIEIDDDYDFWLNEQILLEQISEKRKAL